MAQVLEVKRVCGRCWEEERETTPMIEYDNNTGEIGYHNHENREIRKNILNSLKEKNENENSSYWK